MIHKLYTVATAMKKDYVNNPDEVFWRRPSLSNTEIRRNVNSWWEERIIIFLFGSMYA